MIRGYSQLLILAVLFLSCGKHESEQPLTLPYFNSAEFTPQWIDEESPALQKIHEIPEFSLTDQEGQQVTKDTFKGKIYVASFFFVTCPGICPQLTRNMGLLQEEFLNDDTIMFLSHTVMPEMDSVPVLKRYAENKGIKSNKWRLVTGDKDEIYSLARKAYFADEDFVKTQDENAFIHTENFVLVDKNGRIRGVYNGTIEFDLSRLIRHIKILKREV